MSVELKWLENGTITSPKGYLAGATYSGIRTYTEDKLDLGIVSSEVPCTVAGTFTTNKIVSPCVVLNKRRVASGRAQAIIINSGIANACVGEQGMTDALEMAALAAKYLDLDPELVLACSTGLIGMELPMALINKGVGQIELSEDGGNQLARAMMTTDTKTKEAAVSVNLGGAAINIAGVAKGSGMIHPNMATMLSFITTDAAVDKDFLDATLREVADSSFNMMTVDGDTSTNDTLLVLSNGQAGNSTINSNSPDAAVFKQALMDVCVHLAREMARDGEGATKLITVEVVGATDVSNARKAARTIASSNLVKSAVAGSDPNWGRIMMAVGRSGAVVEESKIDLFINGVCIMEEGKPVPFHRDAVVALMRGTEITLRLNLNLANGEGTAWGCDLTEEYVIINSAYTT